ncbi:hypothetical protein CNR33_00015 [Pseudomonas phage tabernarius]|uniref:Uncharacterized protein n=1 Tax=Pseudomonas phage tabernarius TaxID=2048978 RepID=A0A2H4P6Q9_9CAUD|nr:hypothetical protein FDJ17_gp15 [Pseudomonas phage tabernarius]ATW57861.1 hypothetical protein CNR33_00015 [Pseudomonas phage tabernarius]
MNFLKTLGMGLLMVIAVLLLPVFGLVMALFTWQLAYLKWSAYVVVDFVLTLTIPFVAPFIAAFTSAQPYGSTGYTWGGLYGTYDNPPQGDEGYVAKRSWFPGITTGFKGYLNRIGWMIRNPIYGWSQKVSLPFDPNDILLTNGNPNISDKYKIAGAYHTTYTDHTTGKLIGFEFYVVYPWSETKDIRIRLGWKMTTDKFASTGFAPMVNTLNFLDGYGS